MRTPLAIAFLSVVSVAVAAVPREAAGAEPENGFVAWALERGSEMDLRWSRMTGSGAAAVESPAEFRAEAGTSSPSTRTDRGSTLSHSIIASRSFLHKVSTNAELLPLSTRERNGAARGVSGLKSPSQARLSMPNSVRRPLNSSIQKKNFFRTFGSSVARPKLDSFGRIGRADRGSRGGVSRPAQRAGRPKML